MRALRALIKFCVLVFIGLPVIAVLYSVFEYIYEMSLLPEVDSSATTISLVKQDNVTLFVLGDSGSGFQSQRAVANAMELRCKSRKPDGLLILGDVIYPMGVTSVDDDQWESKLFSVYGGDCLGSVPIYPVLGNHDYHGSVAAWYEMAEQKSRWQFPNRHYSIRFPDVVTIYGIDSYYPVGIKDAIPDFGHKNSGWTIAMGHHPIISSSLAGGGHRGGGVRGWQLKRLLCDNVDSYLAGHAHHLEYITIDDCGSDQYIAGGGGAATYPINPTKNAEFAESEYGFLDLNFSATHMDATFISQRGDILFERHQTQN